MSVNSDFAAWAEPEAGLTELIDMREPESGRHRADTVSNGISVEELLVRVGQSRN
ncbi:hypothetical protein [Kutzneria buriramensis]|uniref:Uncharacterized protein n=1 Tax=Kutzneria buriramensis TaxID=1045776 RepID=A0A3E0H095_9PSEU|nr:hypothetical protein [Kutzneria buriramensis]REH35254.1 hypothetical protein BCF44_118114 [Kutzneria buriramensis]